MADNTTLPTGVGGDTIATDDIGGVKYQRVKLVSGVDGVNDGDASSTNPFPIGIAATPFFPSAGNSSSANLAAGATFTGAVQANQNLPVISINVVCDQPTLVTLYGSTDAAGLNRIAPIVLPLGASIANFGTSVALPSNANYYWVTVQNIGAATSTKCVIDAGAGWLFPTTALGNAPTAINEIGGTVLTLGQKTAAASIPTVLASDQVLNFSQAQFQQLIGSVNSLLIEQAVMNRLLMQEYRENSTLPALRIDAAQELGFGFDSTI
jgi:hypothetical protein